MEAVKKDPVGTGSFFSVKSSATLIKYHNIFNVVSVRLKLC
jgi:hypothetical protein